MNPVEINLQQIAEENQNWNDVALNIHLKNQKQAYEIGSNLILRKHKFKTMYDNEQLWYYKDGYTWHR